MSILTQQQRRLLCLTAALCGVELTSPACKSSAPTPEALCAASETANGLASLIAGDTDLPASDIHLVLYAPVLDSFDKTTKRTTCAATIRPTFSGELGKSDGKATTDLLSAGVMVEGSPIRGALDLLGGRQTYTIQPAADGKGDVYTIGENVILALRAWAVAAREAIPQTAGSGNTTTADDGKYTTTTTTTVEPGAQQSDEPATDNQVSSNPPPTEFDLANDVKELQSECPTAETSLYSWKSSFEERQELARGIEADFDDLNKAHPEQAAPFAGCAKTARNMLGGAG